MQLPSATVKILELMNICGQLVLNTVKTVKGYIYQVLTIGNYLPDTLSCFCSHVVYFVVWLWQVHGVSRHIL